MSTIQYIQQECDQKVPHASHSKVGACTPDVVEIVHCSGLGEPL